MTDDISRMSKKELEREVKRLREQAATHQIHHAGQKPAAERAADEKAAFTLALREVYHDRGFAGVIEEAYRMYEANRAGKTLNTDLRRVRDSEQRFYNMLMSDLEKIARQNPGTTYARAVMLIIDPKHPHKFECKGTKPLPIYAADDISGIWLQMVFAIAQAPQPIDIKTQRIDGIGDGMLFMLLADLFSPEHDPATFEQRRRAMFDRLWEHIEREHPDEYDRLTINNQFNKAVRRTQERMRERIEGITIDLDGEL